MEKKVYKSFGMRNRGALYWIPNEDEWYKAAYYDPTLIGNRKYHDYPTRTSNPPSHKQANYVIQDRLNIGEPFFVANVDSFSDSPSYYGTLQQGGNVWEWLESWQYGNVGVRGLRGYLKGCFPGRLFSPCRRRLHGRRSYIRRRSCLCPAMRLCSFRKYCDRTDWRGSHDQKSAL